MKINSNIMSDILCDAQIGIWVIEFSDDLKPKMYCDKKMFHLLGVSESLSPEEIYSFWYQRIDSRYIECVLKTIEEIRAGNKSEVEYPWNHPQLGWIYVRCGGDLDKSCSKNIFRMKGYHQDITELLGVNQQYYTDHEVVDFYKLKRYSDYFMDNYDELFEVDLEDYSTNTIFYKKDKYASIIEDTSVFELINEHVHEEDIQRFQDIFQPENIQKMIATNAVERVEFRTKTVNGEYEWVCASCFIAELNNKKKLVFYTYDIQAKKKVEILSKEKEDIIYTLVSSNSAIADVDLTTESVKILKGYKNLHEEETSFTKFVKNLLHKFIQPNDHEETMRFLTIENLKSLAKQKKESHIDVRLNIGKFNYEWMRISILIFPDSTDRIFILFKNSKQEYLLQNVMEKFIYNNCDYLYYIDLKHKWYIRFSGNEQHSPIPKGEGSDYIKDMIEYADYYVPKEDREMVKQKMNPDYVMEELDKNGYFSFTTGVLDHNGNYTRKHLQYQYFDKENQIVLLQRIDITENYINNNNQKLELEKLKEEVTTDYLTGIYNRLGCEENIQNYIKQHSKLPLSAFLLIDLDNFKSVNDRLGHKIGDKVLKDVAIILKNSFREIDIVARLGGDEFVVFIKNIRNKESICLIIEKVLKKLYLKYENDTATVQTGASIGISFFPQNGIKFQELYETADQAMYYAKHRQKNTYYIYDNINK